MKESWHFGGKKPGIQMNPLAPQRLSLRYQVRESHRPTGIPDIFRDQNTSTQIRSQVFHQGKKRPVKGHDQNPLPHAGGQHITHHRFSYAWITARQAITPAGFDLDIDLNLPLAREIQRFAQSRNVLWLRPATREVRGRVERTEVSQVEIQNISHTVRQTLHSFVVKNDEMSITAHLDIQFNGVDRERQSPAKSRQSVFGR